jgi:deoxyribodipyrimidine photo-lyase
MAQSPILLWFRRDLRLADHPMVVAAAATGRPLIPIFILDEVSQNLGAAARWRLGLALETFASNLEVLGCRLILRKGSALAVLQKLIGETGADTVFWSRSYIPNVQERDRLVKTALKAKGLNATSFDGHLLFEPWRVATQEGGFYRVYTPFWKSVARRDVPTPVAAPKALHIPSEWPQSAQLREWRLDAPMNRSASILYPYQAVGEAAALRRLELFMAGPL